MSTVYTNFEQRKRDHIEHALNSHCQTSQLSELDNIQLVHEALPEIDFAEVSIATSRLAQKVLSPFFVSSMTAGHKGAIDINANLVAACAQSGWWMGVGSQRRELTDKHAGEEWKSLRVQHPSVNLMSNIGIAQVITHHPDDIIRLCDNLEACALIIHTNPLQECIQPEGTPQFKGGLKAIEILKKRLLVPLIVKETGCGFSSKILRKLDEIGVDAVDVSGLGGTHWGRIEGLRSSAQSSHQLAAQTFKNWGISSVESLQNARSINSKFERWGSGGVRNGLDAAKLIALGATSIGLAKPMLETALISSDECYKLMQHIEYELKVALFCTGSANLEALQESICHN